MNKFSLIYLSTITLLLFVVLAGCNLPINTDAQESGAQSTAPSATPTLNVEQALAEGAQEDSAAQQEQPPTVTPLPTATPIPTPTPKVVRVSYELFASDTLGPDIEQFPEDVSPMTGQRVKDTEMLGLPPVMVSITNFPASARPQAGLSDAPHVFEIYIGEGSTRFLAVFYGVQPVEEPVLTGNLPVREGPFDQFGLIAGNQVWFDENENGIQDLDEWGIGGIGVSLLDGETGRLVDSTITNSNGYFGFNVYPGISYRMLFLLPGGYRFSPQHQGSDPALDSEADPETGLTDEFVIYHSDASLDTGLLLTQAFRHVAEGKPLPPPPVDHVGNGQAFLAKLQEGKIDVTDVNQYTKLLAIMKGLVGESDEVGAAAGLNLPQPSGDQAGLMQSLVDAWDASVASQSEEIKTKVTALASDLRRGNLNQLGNARIMMMILGGVDSSLEASGEFGPFRILPSGENEAVMQELVDAAREGAGNLALVLAQRMTAGDLEAYGEAVRLMLFLREKSYLAEEDLGGILGVVPLGENARAMQEMVYAARVGVDVRTDDIVLRLEQGDLQAIRDGRILMLMLSAGTDFELDDYGLPPAAGENAEMLQRLGDAIRAALNAQLQAGLVPEGPLTMRSGAGALMAMAQSAFQQEGTDPCVSAVNLPGGFLAYNGSNLILGLPQGSMTAFYSEIDNSVVIRQNGQTVANIDVPPGTTVEDGTNNIIFPKGTTVLQDKKGLIYISDPDCKSAFTPQPHTAGWYLIGPTRSGRIYMTQFARIYTGGCVVYAHKDPTVPVSGCQVIVENYNPDDVNAAGFNPENLKSTAAGNAPPGLIPNYSGNSFGGGGTMNSNTLWGDWFFTPNGAGGNSSPISAKQSPVQAKSGQSAKNILVFYSNLNQSYWKYDPLIGQYLRYEDLADSKRVGEFVPSLDRFTGRQLAFSNVAVLFVHHDVVKANVINIGLEGHRGTGKLFRNGQAIDVIWTTLNTDYELETLQMRPLRIEDLDGNPIPLTPGQTWYHIVTETSQVWEIEPEEWKVRFYGPPGGN